MKSRAPQGQHGFTLMELMVSSSVFLVLSGAIFTLLTSSQQQFQAQSQLVGAFDEARLGMDQIVRDVNSAGFPSISNFSQTPNAGAYAMTPFAWDPGYLAAPPALPAPCTIGGGGTCVTPGDFDLIVEGNVDGSGVNWIIRYQLPANSTTLQRGVTPKVANQDPVTATSGVMLPYILNVMNNPGGARIAQIKAIPAYNAMFPGGNPVPVFQYSCDVLNPGAIPNPAPCTNAVANNSPQFVRDVSITLIVMTQQPDPQTGQLRLVELNGRAHRINPIQ